MSFGSFETVLYNPFLMTPVSSSLLLRSCFGLGSLLLVAIDHHNSYECANHGRAQESKEDGDTDRPYAREEKGMKGMTGVDERLDYVRDSRTDCV